VTGLVQPTTMEEGTQFGACCSRSLDKLEQLDQNPSETLHKLRKRARAKYLSLPIVEALAALESPLKRSYESALWCTHHIEQNGGQLKARYCGYRWCLVCNRIRTGKFMNAYEPVLDGWEKKWFVTLTIRNCKGWELDQVYDEMMKAFNSAKRSIKRTHGLKFMALRKYEVTYNSTAGTYHPHFHVLVDGMPQGVLLLGKWKAFFGDRVSLQGQDIKPCDAGSMKEMFKYFTRLLEKSIDEKKGKTFDPVSLDVIFRHMKGRRVYQSVGFTLPKQVEEEGDLEVEQMTPALTRVDEAIMWSWLPWLGDWIDLETGELLVGQVQDGPTVAFVGDLYGRAPPLI